LFITNQRRESDTNLIGPHRADDTADLGVLLGLQIDCLTFMVPETKAVLVT